MPLDAPEMRIERLFMSERRGFDGPDRRFRQNGELAVWAMRHQPQEQFGARVKCGARDASANADRAPDEDRTQEFAGQSADGDIAPPPPQRRLEAAHHQHAMDRWRLKAESGGDGGIEMQRIVIAGRLRVARETLRPEWPEMGFADRLADLGPVARRAGLRVSHARPSGQGAEWSRIGRRTVPAASKSPH